MFRSIRRPSIVTIRRTALFAVAAALLLRGAHALILHHQNAVRAAGMTAANWVKAAAENEIHIIQDDGSASVRYRMLRTDPRESVTRDVIECKEGSVARTIERNGKPLTAEQDKAERDRLEEILADPATYFKHEKRNQSARSYATQLVSLMPTALLYSYAPGQPQPPNATTPQIVIDFKPDPNFRPPSTVAQLLTGLEGRMWIDKRSQRLTRVEGRVVKPVNFGWGVLAHIYPGGTIEFEQAEAGPGRWIYSHLDENITVREMMLHTLTEKQEMTATDIRLLSAPITYREAIHQLLDMKIPLR